VTYPSQCGAVCSRPDIPSAWIFPIKEGVTMAATACNAKRQATKLAISVRLGSTRQFGLFRIKYLVTGPQISGQRLRLSLCKYIPTVAVRPHAENQLADECRRLWAKNISKFASLIKGMELYCSNWRTLGKSCPAASSLNGTRARTVQASAQNFATTGASPQVK
jgi:hypothetical protein